MPPLAAQLSFPARRKVGRGGGGRGFKSFKHRVAHAYARLPLTPRITNGFGTSLDVEIPHALVCRYSLIMY